VSEERAPDIAPDGRPLDPLAAKTEADAQTRAIDSALGNLTKKDGPERGIDPSRVGKLEAEVDRLGDLAATVLVDDEPEQAKVFERLIVIKKSLSNLPRNMSPLETLAAAELEVKSLRSKITKRELIEDEQRRLRHFVPALIAVYIVLLTVVILSGYHVQPTSLTLPIIGVPVSVLVWAGIGSLAAILYRFYTQEIGRMNQELRWLIARPIIGIIMGSISYLGILSGLLILSATDGKAGSVRDEVVWLLAFLGGFSDRFFESVISALLARVPISSQPSEAQSDHSRT
jgi:hypothetical protein